MLRIILIAVITLSVVALATATCDDYSKNEAKCMATTEDSVNCSYCTSAAVGSVCAKETDTKTLPTSVFHCEFQDALQAKATPTCDDYSKNEAKCMATTEDSVNCSYCTSAAVGSVCAKETDTKTLPTSVFHCEFQSASSFQQYNTTTKI